MNDIINGHALKLDFANSISSHMIADINIPEVLHEKQNIIPFLKYYPNILDEIFSKNILVANENFGYGTAKELPAVILKKAGIKAIISKYYSPFFYKNAFNIGLLCLEANTDYINDNDELKIDLKRFLIQNQSQKIGIKIKPLLKYFYKIYKSNGLLYCLEESND